MARKSKGLPLYVYEQGDAGNLTKIKEILQGACDRDWKDESLYTTAMIVANSAAWRNAEIEVLKQDLRNLIAYFEKRSKENDRRATSKENDSEVYATAQAYEVAAEFLHSSYYLSGKSDTYHRAADKLREILGINRCWGNEEKHEDQKQEEKQSWPFGW